MIIYFVKNLKLYATPCLYKNMNKLISDASNILKKLLLDVLTFKMHYIIFEIILNIRHQ